MGCCASTNRSPDSSSPYGNTTPTNHTTTQTSDPHQQHGSALSISPSALAPVASQSPLITNYDTSSRTRRTSPQSSNVGSPRTAPTANTASTRRFKHPNKPLNQAPKSHLIQPPPPFHTDSGSGITRRALLRERDAFFETRVTGRSEVWAAVRLVCDLIEQGELGEAQAVLEAAGCTCPSGDLWGRKGGVYDELGEKYVVPTWVVGEPPGMTDEDAEVVKETGSGDTDTGKRKDEKGKGRLLMDEMEGEGDMKVKVRLSHTAQDIIIRTRDGEEVSVLLRRIVEKAELHPLTKVKIGYLGKLLHENESLAAQGWAEGHILNVYVLE